MVRLTNEQIEAWMGQAPIDEYIDTLTAIANGEYSPSQLRADIEDTLDIKE